MILTPIKANMNEVIAGNLTVLFSYKTPVAYHKEGDGYYRTSKFWSVTTSRHINQWLKLNGALTEGNNHLDNIKEVDQSILDHLLDEVK